MFVSGVIRILGSLAFFIPYQVLAIEKEPAGDVLRQAAPAVLDTGNTAWMLVSCALVLLMVPGLAMFYGGLTRTRNVLGTMMHSFAAMGIFGVQWVIVGFALAFGTSALIPGILGWSTDFLFLQGVKPDDLWKDTGVPTYLFAMFQGKFAIITPALIAGAFAERVRFKSYCIFILLWGFLVYDPLAYLVWNENGMLFKEGAIDFAGGTVVHISAGIAGLVAVLLLGPRKGYPHSTMKPNNLTMSMTGSGLLWIGWFGFNAGSAVSADASAVLALTTTQTAAAAGAVGWMLTEMFHYGKASALGLVSGIVAGLVAITPATGSVTPAWALVFGFGAAVLSYQFVQLKVKMGYDDTLDVFGIHGIGGIFGALLVGLAATDVGGWAQLMVQAKSVLIAITLSGSITAVLVSLIGRTIGFRTSEEDEQVGLDHSQHGEVGYGLTHL